MKKLNKSLSKRTLEEREEDTISRKSEIFKDKCAECLRGPKQILRTIVLLSCTVVVIYQIAQCLNKIQYPPTTTYTHFDFNASIMYPAITLCRDPPYKTNVLKKHGLVGHPRVTSNWKYFPYSTVSLDDFWEEATYNDTENILRYALLGSPDNVRIKNHLHFMYGKCQTLYPKILMTVTDKDSGYSILLNHSLSDMQDSTSRIPPGYHLFIHQTIEEFTEPTTGTLVDYMYVNVGEELDVKLGVQEVNMLVGGPKSCEGRRNYSVSKCMFDCRLSAVMEDAECSGPWLPKSDLPRCNNYTRMRDLLVDYIRVYENTNLECPCLTRCRFKFYTSHVVDRNRMTVWNSQLKSYILKSEAESEQTQIYIYFNSKTVSVYEEKHGYDWSLFLADFGGSLGFLLGLSVLGIITLLENLYEVFLKPFMPKSIRQEEHNRNDYKKDRELKENGKMQRSGDGDSFSCENFVIKKDCGDKANMNILHMYGNDKNFDKNFHI